MKTRVLTIIVLSMLAVSVAYGQATRTWVSGVGDDVNPCSRTAPCKTFAGAISKTAAGGQISVLDPGGYGAVTITKSITLEGEGTLGSILHSAVNGIIINAAATDTIIIRNIQLDGAGTTTGTNGISILNAKAVIVENCSIINSQKGISATPSLNQVQIYVRNTTIADHSVNGVFFQPTGAGSVFAELDDVRISRIGTTTAHDGIFQGASVGGHYRNVNVHQASGSGLHLNGASCAATVERSTFWRNGQHGIHANNGVVRVASSFAAQNVGSGFRETVGTISSWVNNNSFDNGAVDSAATPLTFY